MFTMFTKRNRTQTYETESDEESDERSSLTINLRKCRKTSFDLMQEANNDVVQKDTDNAEVG